MQRPIQMRWGLIRSSFQKRIYLLPWIEIGEEEQQSPECRNPKRDIVLGPYTNYR